MRMISIYELINGANISHNSYDNEDVINKVKNKEIRAYSEIFYSGWHYNDPSFHKKISSAIEANKDLFITLNSDTLFSMKTHFSTKLSPARPVYEILLPTCWKKVILKGELNSTNKINSDEDSLTDWEEVDVDKLIKLSDGNYTLPHVSVNELVGILNRFDSDDYLFIAENKAPVYYLPILSDPTKNDSDGDGILDPDEYTNLTTDSRYDNINPLKSDTLETLYPELTQNSDTNVDTNPIYLDINNNNIILKVKYKLSGLSEELSWINVPGTELNYTNKEIIFASINNKWNTAIEGSKYDFYPGMKVNINVELENKSFGDKYIEFKVTQSEGNYYNNKSASTWTTENIRIITLSIEGDTNFLPKVNRFSAPAHEFGHALGLTDLYGYSNNSNWRLQSVIYDISKTTQNEIWYNYGKNNPDGDLMYSFGLVRANDIEMILQAYCDNQEQYFRPEFDKENEVSKAIKENQGNIYLDRYNKEFVIYDSESKTTTSIGDADLYKTYLKDNYEINVTITELEEIYGRDNITSS